MGMARLLLLACGTEGRLVARFTILAAVLDGRSGDGLRVRRGARASALGSLSSDDSRVYIYFLWTGFAGVFDL
jgi:hypothetical protein